MASASAAFDRIIDRRGTWSSKWEKYAGRDVLPFWVADMDFPAPRFILDALRRRIDHEILGYTRTPATLNDAFRGWLVRHYGWSVPESWLVWIPGVVTGFNLAARAAAVPGGSILIPTPVYYPFLEVPQNSGQQGIEVPLVKDGRRWVMDFDALERAVQPSTRILLFCNPQNPTGRAYRESELRQLAEFCLRHDLVLCSDEIHCQIVLDPDASHTPIATLAPEIAERTITLYAATKAYNIPGLTCAVAVIPNPALRQRFKTAQAGIVPSVGPLELVASEAAFADTGPWLSELLDYLRGNHERLAEVAGERMTPVEATYLAWLDVRDLGLDNPGAWFESHGLGLSDGAAFGGPGFVRFNFGCPRGLLERGLERLEAALRAAESR
ncbi:MAG TPA: PatB family C-S lyase [Pseudomonadales bacterium]